MPTLSSIIDEDAQLLEEFVTERPQILRDSNAFYTKVSGLLNDIHTVSSEVSAKDEYTSLEKRFGRWRDICLFVLHMPVTTSLNRPAQALTESRPVWTAEALQKWHDDKAWQIFRQRAVEAYYRVSEEHILARHPSNEKEYESDGHAAKIYMGCDVLDGTSFDFVRDFDAASYCMLEGDCWLQEAKNLKAYFRWRRHPAGDANQDYLDACGDLGKRLREAERSPQTSFQRVVGYLLSRYLTYVAPSEPRDASESLPAEAGGPVPAPGSWTLNKASNDTRRLIEVKAWLAWKQTGDPNQEANWVRAEKFAEDFYQNIIPAVTLNDETSARTVLRALLTGAADETDLANCFEAAIAIYFINAAIVGKLLNESVHG